MPQHESKQCPRCNKDFECKSGSILLCQCSKITLTLEQLEYTNVKYNECLCLACLQALQTEFNTFSHNKRIKNILLGQIKQ